MHVIAWILSGIAAGWLTGYALKREGYGVLGNLLIGSIGGVVGGWALEYALGITVAGGWGAHVWWAAFESSIRRPGARSRSRTARRTASRSRISTARFGGWARSSGESSRTSWAGSRWRRILTSSSTPGRPSANESPTGSPPSAGAGP